MHLENFEHETELALHHSNATMVAKFAAPQHNTDKDLEPPTLTGVIFITKTYCMWAYLRVVSHF